MEIEKQLMLWVDLEVFFYGQLIWCFCRHSRQLEFSRYEEWRDRVLLTGQSASKHEFALKKGSNQAFDAYQRRPDPVEDEQKYPGSMYGSSMQRALT